MRATFNHGGLRFHSYLHLKPLALTRVFLFLLWLLSASLTNGQLRLRRTWTYNQPGVSYTGFKPQLKEDTDQHYVLTFKTTQANGILMHHHIVDIAAAGIPSLEDYQLFLELRDGRLRAGFVLNHFRDVLVIGKALNDDHWHSAELVVDVAGEELRLTLDGVVVSEELRAYHWGKAKAVLVWSHLESWVTVGAVPSVEGSQVFRPFVGCIQNVEYAMPDGVLVPVHFNTSVGVTPGCVDKCRQATNPCNLGKCVNMYTDIRCDCYGTDYEGDHCQKEDATIMTFRGYDWVTHRLYDDNTDKLFMEHAKISMEFKTDRNSGVLLYAVGGSPFHSHVTVSVYSGEIHASVSFEKDDVTFSGGIGLDDGRWHNLTIVHRKEVLMFYLDGKVSQKKVTKGGYYLSLDPYVYIGGGDNFVQTKSLPVTRNFVGCLRNVFINGVSVLYELSAQNPRCVYHGGKSPRFGCHQVDEVPISFPRFSSMLIWTGGRDRESDLIVKFKIRTFSSTAIVLFTEIMSRKDTGSGYDFGSIQLWLVDKMAVLQFNPSSPDEAAKENVTLPVIVSDGTIHTVAVTLIQSQVKLKIDDYSVTSKQYDKILEHRGKVVLGYTLRQIEEYYGFVGCMQQIEIQHQRLDPIAIVDSDAAVGLILDGCQLTDHCATSNICEHGSECLSDWEGVHCICHKDYYEGKACHFAKYFSTCEDYHRMGYRETGVYMIDVDGPMRMEPAYVKCEMDKLYRGGVTVVEHNFPRYTSVRAPWMADVQYHLKYRDFSREQLTTLTRISEKCEQFLKYQCLSSPLRLSSKTWFKSVNGEIVDYIGSHQSGYCDCPKDTGCGGKNCYCDHGSSQSRFDSGYNRERRQLPIMEMTFIQNDEGQGHMTLGPLRCWGSETQPANKPITLARSSSFVRLPKWKSGELKLNFKTHEAHSLLIYHRSRDQKKPNSVPKMFAVKLVSSHEVEFIFQLETHEIRETLYSANHLDKGDWHVIAVEHDNYNIRLTLDSTRVLIKKPTEEELLQHFDGSLYLGGIPEQLSEQMGKKKVGFTGCLYGLVYNEESVNLQDFVDNSMSGVSVDCKSSCWPNPCQNGGVCEENWEDHSYKCICSDPWAHMGANCEKDLNQDAVTFSGLSPSYLFFDITHVPNALDDTLVISFRTFLNEAFLIYVHDQMGNFVQLVLSDPRTITISYNNYNQIVRESISKEDVLNDGEWKQVVAENYYNYTRLMVMGSYKVVEENRGRLRAYSPDPFMQSDKEQLTYINRPTKHNIQFVHAYVGNVKDGATSTSSLLGCVRGVKISSYAFNLTKAARQLGNSSLVAGFCEKGCVEDSCHNNGHCQEHWRNKQFTCDCDENGFSGTRCEIEPSVSLKGKTVIQHTFQPSETESYTVSERLSFRFKADIQPYRPYDMVMFYVLSSRTDDYILAYLDPSGSVLLETNQGIGMYRIKVAGRFADGKPHDFIYIRQGSNMYLKVDGIKEAQNNYPDYPLNNIDMINIGGCLKPKLHFRNMFNFSGCISNTAYVPKEGSGSPNTLHTLRDLYLSAPRVTVVGETTQSCSTSRMIKPTTAPTTKKRITPNTFMDFSMPPWENPNLKIVTLSVAPAQSSPPTSPPHLSSTKVVTNGTHPAIYHNTDEPVDDITIIIIVSAIGAILVISLCCVLICVRKKKRNGDYIIKKEVDHDMELIQPLNHLHENGPSNGTPPFISHTMPKSILRSNTSEEKSTKILPNDHLAKLDEFSMITAILGPRAPAKADTLPADFSKKRYSKGSYPLADDEMDYINPIYNARKQRPASSISEVLEELERRQIPHTEGTPEGDAKASGGTGGAELELEPQGDILTPITFKGADTLEGSSSPQGSSQMNSGAECNGDSGYEAESRPEITEEEISPKALNDDDDDATLPHKLFSFQCPEAQSDSSLNLSGISTKDTQPVYEGTSV